MYSLVETVKTYSDLTKIKQSTSNSEVRSTIDDFFSSLGTHVVVITEEVEPLDDIVVTSDPNPVEHIVVTTDPNPPITFLAVKQELNEIIEADSAELTKAAAAALIAKIGKIEEALAALI